MKFGFDLTRLYYLNEPMSVHAELHFYILWDFS